METLLQDVRYGLRTMTRNPAFIVTAIISLSLGIGPNTLVFSAINALLLRPLPVEKPDEFVRVFRSDENGPYNSVSYPDYVDYRDRQQVFTGLCASQRTMMSLNIDGRSEVIPGAVVSTNFFSILGVRPSLGRVFTPEEDRSPGRQSTAVISNNLWVRRFDADPGLLGRTLRLNGHSFTIIGVADRGFNGIDAAFSTDIWVPIEMFTKLVTGRGQSLDPITGREETWINNLIGRLKPGVSIEQAQASLSNISAELDRAYPSSKIGRRRILTLVPLSSGHPEIRAEILSFAALLMTLAGLVMVIACANVANLLLTRALARSKEIAIRLAIGANRWRLMRQLLTESVLLALAGGFVGTLMAYWTSELALTLLPSISIQMAIDLRVDARVLGFSVALSSLVGIAFGLAPALRTSRPDLAPALKAETVLLGRGFRESRLQNLLVIIQMALSVALLVSAALLFRSMRNISNADLGFEKKNLALLSMDLDHGGYKPGDGMQFYQRLIDRVRTLPGLKSVSLTNAFPLSMESTEVAISIEGHESNHESGVTAVGTINVAPGYFETMGIPLIQGREFSPHDTEKGPKVIIVNQTMATRFWPGDTAIGKRIKVDPLAPQSLYYEVVGVVKDSKFLSPGEGPRSFMYGCILQQYSSSATLVARTEPNPEGMLATIRREVQSLDGSLPVFDVKTVKEHLSVSLFPLRMAAALLGFLGAFALLLASVGLYSVVAYSVTLRTREFGIRMALGARPVQVLKYVLMRGAALAMIGIVIGLLLALVMARAMSNLDLFYGISAIDPATFLGVPILLISVAALASYVPARRATKIDPTIALR